MGKRNPWRGAVVGGVYFLVATALLLVWSRRSLTEAWAYLLVAGGAGTALGFSLGYLIVQRPKK